MMAPFDASSGLQPTSEFTFRSATGALEAGTYEVWMTWDPSEFANHDTADVTWTGDGLVTVSRMEGDISTERDLFDQTLSFRDSPGDATDSAGVEWRLLGEVLIDRNDQILVSIAHDHAVTEGDVKNLILGDSVQFIRSGENEIFHWDHRSRLTAVDELDGYGRLKEHVEYAYDALNRKIGRAVYVPAGVPPQIDSSGNLDLTSGDGVNRKTWTGYVNDGTSVALEFNEFDQITRSYFNGPGVNEVLAIDEVPLDDFGFVRMTYDSSGNNVFEKTDTVWLFADLAGTVRSLGRRYEETVLVSGVPTTVTKWSILHRAFGEFGELRDIYGATEDFYLTQAPIIWGGHQLDAVTGLYYAKARWYDAVSHRFISQDPLGVTADSKGNPYRYGHNNPVTYTDSSGMLAETIWDGASIGLGWWSLQNSIAEGDVTGATVDAVGIAVDAVALVLPGIPGGVGYAIKAARAGKLVNRAFNVARTVERIGSTVRHLKNPALAADTAVQIVSTGVAVRRGDPLGTFLGAAGLGIRGAQGVSSLRAAKHTDVGDAVRAAGNGGCFVADTMVHMASAGDESVVADVQAAAQAPEADSSFKWLTAGLASAMAGLWGSGARGGCRNDANASSQKSCSTSCLLMIRWTKSGARPGSVKGFRTGRRSMFLFKGDSQEHSLLFLLRNSLLSGDSQ